MLYTSYFANLKNLPKDVVPISICGKAPAWYDGLQYRRLAPKYEFFKVWKETHDNDYYIILSVLGSRSSLGWILNRSVMT